MQIGNAETTWTQAMLEIRLKLSDRILIELVKGDTPVALKEAYEK